SMDSRGWGSTGTKGRSSRASARRCTASAPTRWSPPIRSTAASVPPRSWRPAVRPRSRPAANPPTTVRAATSPRRHRAAPSSPCAPRPRFAHLPLILGLGKSRLSKRHGATAVTSYRERGYLPDALVNYLARLGWSHGDQELFSRAELIEAFSLENVGKSPSVFN